MDTGLKNHVAFLIGAFGGIGRAVEEALWEAGAANPEELCARLVSQ